MLSQALIDLLLIAEGRDCRDLAPCNPGPAHRTSRNITQRRWDQSRIRHQVAYDPCPQSTAAILEELGHRALKASSGREALEYLGRAHSVDSVITDQAMPGMTGVQLAATIKQQWPHLPVILAWGYADLPSNLELSLIRLNKPSWQDRLAQAISVSVQNAWVGKVIRLRPK
jgi:CheY-like chemotaxis protein